MKYRTVFVCECLQCIPLHPITFPRNLFEKPQLLVEIPQLVTAGHRKPHWRASSRIPPILSIWCSHNILWYHKCYVPNTSLYFHGNRCVREIDVNRQIYLDGQKFPNRIPQLCEFTGEYHHQFQTWSWLQRGSLIAHDQRIQIHLVERLRKFTKKWVIFEHAMTSIWGASINIQPTSAGWMLVLYLQVRSTCKMKLHQQRVSK